jgi:hypothetical protein
MAAARIPMPPLLVIAAHVCNTEVLQVVCPTEAARLNVFNRRPIARPRIKA